MQLTAAAVTMHVVQLVPVHPPALWQGSAGTQPISPDLCGAAARSRQLAPSVGLDGRCSGTLLMAQLGWCMQGTSAKGADAYSHFAQGSTLTGASGDLAAVPALLQDNGTLPWPISSQLHCLGCDAAHLCQVLCSGKMHVCGTCSDIFTAQLLCNCLLCMHRPPSS